ncbi:MAG: carboxypeptidase regulatory-like domain-containing protein [Planctomycetales bacterium]|nr:carboxypeptidase regulatory-like domain-containing protein [Planctomycetales bacterium]
MSGVFEGSMVYNMLVDGPWWSMLLFKLTSLLVVAWALHFIMVRFNPRWRVVLWRATAVGLISVATIALVPWMAVTVSIRQTDVSSAKPDPPNGSSIAANSALIPQPDFILENVLDRPDATTLENGLAGIPASPPIGLPETAIQATGHAEVGNDSVGSAFYLSWALIKSLAVAAWGAGVVVVAFRRLVGRRKLNHWIATSGVPQNWILEEADRLSAAMNAPKCSLRTIDSDGSPLLCASRFGPVLLLPQSILESTDRDELIAILTHELSHLRSNDLVWNAIIRMIAMSLWPHPLAWKLAEAHTAACEYSADADSARRLGDADLYRRTLAKVALSASRRPAPGLAMARVADVRRRLEWVTKSVLSVPLTRRQVATFSCVMVITALGIGTLKFVNAQPPAAQPPAEAQEPTADDVATKETNSAKSSSAKSMTIRLTDPAGDPIENGKFTVQTAGASWSRVTLTPVPLPNGAVRLDLPETPGHLLVEVEAAGYVPMKAAWQIDEWDNLPTEFVIPMQKGTTISGNVHDEQGLPIANAEVQILAITSELRNARVRTNVYRYPVKTDKGGRWVCDVAPAQLNDVWLRFIHGDYISDDTFGQTANNISIDQLRAGTLVSVLKKGTTVRGKITNKEGQPIAGAVVYQGKDRFGSSYPDTTTNAEGVFQFPNSRFGEMTLTIVAKGYAPEIQMVDVARDMAPVTIALKPGNRLRVRTVDADGQPLGNIMIVPDTWRGIRSLPDAEIPRASDQDGVYVWEDAPADVIEFDILAPGYMDHRHEKLTARDEEYTITMTKPLRVHGTVVDKTSGEAIPEFKVVGGIKWDQGDYVRWELQDAVQGKNGNYEIVTTFPRPGHLFRFDAIGYRSVVSPVFQSDQGDVLYDVTMEPVAALTGKVQLVSGEPAVGAQVIINTAGNHVAITNGRFSDARDAVFTTTDAAGTFELPTPEQDFRLVVIHDQGMVESAGSDLEGGQALVLKPWASVRGVIKIGANPAKQFQVSLSHINEIPYQQPRFHFGGQTVTDDQGRYELLRVPADQKFQLSRIVEGTQLGYQTYTHTFRFETRPGSEHEINLGGTGRPVVGRVIVPDGLSDYRIGNSFLMPKLPEPPMPDEIANGTAPEKQAWLEQWTKTEAGMIYTAKAMLNLAVVVQADGTFRVEDVPEGKYTMSVVALASEATADYAKHEQIGLATLEVDVPEMPSGRSDDPLDVGSLEVQPRVFLHVGDSVPALDVKSLDGQPLSLADFHGKYVLLDFWATWCGPCLAEIPNLQKAYKRFAEEKNLVILSVSVDAKLTDAAKYVDDNALPWPQGHVAADDQQRVMSDFGLQSIPATFLIDPNGKIVAKNLRGADLDDQLSKLIQN